MIDLSQTRANLLAEIEGRELPSEPLNDITDPRVATTDTHVRLLGHGREDLFPLLKLALAERFAAVPRVQLTRDLLMPVKHALGNAYKHGNATDPAKAVSVDIVLTGKGALIAVTDQGVGFDVARTFQRFQGQENYFLHFGIGFRNLHRAKSTVSYENGGRTVLVCFRPVAAEPPTKRSVDGPGPQQLRRDTDLEPRSSFEAAADQGDLRSEIFAAREKMGRQLPKVLDAAWMQTCLSAELPEFGNGETRLESCRIYPTGERTGDDCGNRFVLRVATRDGGLTKTRILTGRIHATEAAAKADFEAAARLHEAKLSKSLRRPRPVARPAGEPRLVLYDFDPWMNLWEYHTYRGSLKFLRRFAAKIGRAIARLHGSEMVFPEVEPAEEKLQAMVARAQATLQALPAGQQLVNRFRVSVQQILDQAALRRQRDSTPIHGALGWDCIQYGVDGKFYLYRFENCQRSDAAFDLGGFAADLLCFTLASYDEAAYRLCSNSFLFNYNSKAEHPVCEDELQPYIVLALCERLHRMGPHAQAQATPALGALLTVLCNRESAAGSEVS